MNDVFLTGGDLIQICLFLAACYACYWKGRHQGMVDIVLELVDRGLLDAEDLEEEEP